MAANVEKHQVSKSPSLPRKEMALLQELWDSYDLRAIIGNKIKLEDVFFILH